MRSPLLVLSAVLLLAVLAGCAAPVRQGAPADPSILTPESMRLAPRRPPPTLDGPIILGDVDGEREIEPPEPEIRYGTGEFLDKAIARIPPSDGGGAGQVVFNFENQPVQAVVKAILGDLLQENYIIAPNVGGNVTFSTSRPLRTDQAMPVLETLLSWTGNTLVYEDGRYTVLPIAEAIRGRLPPRLGPAATARGFEVRVYPLRYISPSEMVKLLQPYVKAEGIVHADPARSMIVMAGTASELANYERTIETFDVDWLKGMSVGVYTLRYVEVEQLLPDLQKVFGTEGESPLAGMFRFLPITQVNSMIVITPNPEYLHQAQEWIRRLDRGASEHSTQLYVYDVKNIKALDLADYLNQIFLGSSSGGSRSGTSGSVGPGQRAITIGGIGGSGGQAVNRSLRPQSDSERATPVTPAGEGSVLPEGSNIRISAVEENNQLLVMAMPGEWESIQGAIRKLDISPLQVQIEARILEVSLTGALEFGVQWWFGGLQGNPERYDNGSPYRKDYERHKSLLGAAGPGQGGTLFWSYINSKFEVALSALESSGNAKALAAPSLVVMNNQEAQINVGTQIPITQTYISTFQPIIPGDSGSGSGSRPYGGTGSVQYLNTGIILSVVPRVNPGGLVYLDVQQEVSNPGPAPAGQNPPINQRQLQTSVAVQSGETVLLAGLIQENNSVTDTGVPFLNRLPMLGRLFGSTKHSRDRTELIVMITPRVIYNTDDARELTEQYQRGFESLQPLGQDTRNRILPQAPASTRPRGRSQPAQVMPLDPVYNEDTRYDD